MPKIIALELQITDGSYYFNHQVETLLAYYLNGSGLSTLWRWQGFCQRNPGAGLTATVACVESIALRKHRLDW